MSKEYIGSTTTAEWDAASEILILSVENGMGSTTDTIFLNLEEVDALGKFILKFMEEEP
jgi:hypothetical protein